MNTDKTLFVDVKDMEKDGDQVWFKGSFPALTKEIKNGNKLAGISLVKGRIGFTFSDEPEVEKTPETVDYKPTDAILDGQEVTENGEYFVIRAVKVLKGMDEIIPSIARKIDTSEDEIKKMVFVAGSNTLLERINGILRPKEEESFIKKLFK